MRLLRNRKGQGMSEYLIILALVAIATIGAVIFFADNVKNQLQNVATEISGTEATTSTVGTEPTLGRGMGDYVDEAPATSGGGGGTP